MGRLIDAESWIGELNNIVSDENMPKGARTWAVGMIAHIKQRQTAYDADKVIELLDRRIEFLDATNKLFIKEGDSKNADLNAIRMKEVIAIKEIVRKGGVDG